MTNTPSFSNQIKLKLDESGIGSTDSPKEITVRCSSTFNAIFDDYELKNKVQHKGLRFIYRGRIIKGTETPSSLKMKNDDTIQIINSNSNYTNMINKSTKIVLSLIDPDGVEHPSEIKIDRTIKDWLKKRCLVLDLDYDSLSFFINDNLIDVDKTPHQMKLVNNDKITARYRINNADTDIANKCYNVQTKIYEPPTNTTPLNTAQQQSFMNLIIRGPNGEIIQARVDPNVSFKHSFKPLLKEYDLKVTDYYFIFNNQSLNGNTTPNDLQMKEGDTIKMKKRSNHKHSHDNSKSEVNLESTCILI